MLKKFLTVLTTLNIIFNFTISAFATTTYKSITVDVPPNMLILGDSIATGYGLDGYAEYGKSNCNSYANQLAWLYDTVLDGTTDFKFENLAIDGQTSTELLQDLQNGIYDEKLKDADAIVMSIGGNDLLTIIRDVLDKYKQKDNINMKEIFNTLSGLTDTINSSLEIYEKNLIKITSYINEKTDGVLVLQTLYNPFNQMTDKIPIKNFTEEKIGKLNNIVLAHKNGEKSEYLVADVYSEFVDRADELTNIKSFDIHPNQAGHDVIFQIVDKTIREKDYSYSVSVTSQPVIANAVSKGNDKLMIAIIVICFIAIAAAALIIIVKKFIRRKDH